MEVAVKNGRLGGGGRNLHGTLNNCSPTIVARKCSFLIKLLYRNTFQCHAALTPSCAPLPSNDITA